VPASEIAGAVEGDLDEAILRRVANCAGLTVRNVYGRRGKPNLLRSLTGYNNAARFARWVVVIDLDQDFECAPLAIQNWLPIPFPHMCLRIAVRAVEAWLIADVDGISAWLNVAPALIPNNPDQLSHPKRELVNLARRSRRGALKEELVPREGSGREVGALYTARVMQFIEDDQEGWQPERAAQNSDSLERFLRRIKQFAT